MEGITDFPFRIMCKKFGADVVYTEFVNVEGLVRNNQKTHNKMFFTDEERPFGIQIYGGNKCSMENAAKIVEKLNPDLIDINCGCWVKNVVGNGSGAGLLKDLIKMEAIISSTVKSVKIPVTVKTRLGWDENSINILEVAKLVENAGAKALTIHCRTRSQGHNGDADYSFISKVKESVKIPIIVNGNIFSQEKAIEVFKTTNCDGVMIARGAIGNPWIFRSIKNYFATKTFLPPPSLKEKIDIMLNHLQLEIEYKGEKRGVIEFRKYYNGYLKNFSNIAQVRAKLMLYISANEIFECIENYFNNTILLEVENLSPLSKLS